MSATPDPRDAWIAAEPRLGPTLRRVLRRALRSRRRVLVLAAVISTALVGNRLRRAPQYEVSLDFRVEESEVASQQGPPPPRDIREHVANVALSRHHLDQLMRRYHLYDQWLDVDREAAMADFRRDLDLSVSRNFFITARHPDDPPRTAQVTLSYLSEDLELARAVLQDIADTLRAESTRRTVDLVQGRALLVAELEAARDRRARLEAQVASVAGKRETAPGTDQAALRGRLAALRAELDVAILSEAALERRAKELEFGASAELSSLGLRFTLADERIATYSPRLEVDQILLRIGGTFASVLLLVILAVGAFDDRIQSAEDIEWWGLPLFGTLRAFPGDDMGSQRARAHRPEVAP